MKHNDISLSERLSQKLSENLDELLVDNGIEKNRPHIIETNSPITKYMGLVVSKRIPPRVTIEIELNKDKPLDSFFIVTYQNCSCRFKITDCSIVLPEHTKHKKIKPIIKIKTFIKQMWRNYQHAFFELLDELYDTPRDKINKILANQQNKPR